MSKEFTVKEESLKYSETFKPEKRDDTILTIKVIKASDRLVYKYIPSDEDWVN